MSQRSDPSRPRSVPLFAAGPASGSPFSDFAIPRIALMTAAFFVASLIHVPIGPTSVHLLLNGLVGVLLGWRSALAIAVGLLLHGLPGGETDHGVEVPLDCHVEPDPLPRFVQGHPPVDSHDRGPRAHAAGTR